MSQKTRPTAHHTARHTTRPSALTMSRAMTLGVSATALTLMLTLGVSVALAQPTERPDAQASTSSAAAAATTYTIKVTLRGVKPKPGVLWCALYKSAQGFPMEPSRALARQRADQAHTCTFTVDRPGDYAIVALHDEDADGRQRLNLLGVPQEGWGTSQDVKPALRAPTFEESRFKVSAPVTSTQITMRY